MSKQFETEKETAGTQDRDIVSRLWDFFISMKLGLILFLLIAIASIAGTVIPQGRPPQEYDPNLYPIYEALGLTDAYHAWWYQLLLFLLLTNLFICTVNRFQPLVKSFREPLTRVSGNFLKKLKSYHGEGLKMDSTEAAAAVASLLKKGGFSLTREEEGNQVFLYGEKGRFGPWGSFITHAAFIVIVVGALIGTYFGYEGNRYIIVGETFTISQVDGFESMNPSRDFPVRLNQFQTLFREDMSIKDWISSITVLDGQKEVPFDVRVNHPAEYKGIKIYQSSYGAALHYRIKTGQGQEKDAWLPSYGFDENEQPIRIPNSDYTLVIMTRYDNRITTNTSDPVGANAQNPMVAYAVLKGDKVEEIKVPEFNKPIPIGEATVTFVEYAPMTGLTFRYDPGVPVVWVGSAMLVIGMLISFYTPHRRVWAIITNDNGHTSLEIGGQAQKNKLGFAREFEQLIEEWKLSTKH